MKYGKKKKRLCNSYVASRPLAGARRKLNVIDVGTEMLGEMSKEIKCCVANFSFRTEHAGTVIPAVYRQPPVSHTAIPPVWFWSAGTELYIKVVQKIAHHRN